LPAGQDVLERVRQTSEALGAVVADRANAPLLHDEAFALLVAQIELLPRDGFGRLSIRGLDDSEKFAALADYDYPPDTERQRRPRAGCLHRFRSKSFWTGRSGHAEMTMVTL
jgi:hypothetical protein